MSSAAQAGSLIQVGQSGAPIRSRAAFQIVFAVRDISVPRNILDTREMLRISLGERRPKIWKDGVRNDDLAKWRPTSNKISKGIVGKRLRFFFPFTPDEELVDSIFALFRA